MSRGGSSKQQVGSLRTCIGCRAARPPGMLVRLAVAPEGVVVDRRRRIPGRGAWVCQDPTCAKRAARHLARALRLPRQEVRVDDFTRLLAGEVPVLGARVGQDG